MTQLTLKVEGMSCNHCVTAIEKGLEKVGAKGKANLKEKQITIHYDEKKWNVANIKEAIEEQGYDVV